MPNIADLYLNGSLNAWTFEAAHNTAYLAKTPTLSQRNPLMRDRPPLDDVFIPRILARACKEKYGPDWVFWPQYQKYGTCFHGSERVTMENGKQIPIASVRVGDKVLTHTGEARKVLECHRNLYDGWFARIETHGSDQPLDCTAYHPVWCRRLIRREGESTVLSQAHWVPAKEIRTGDFICVPYAVQAAAPSVQGSVIEESRSADTVSGGTVAIRSRMVAIQGVRSFRDDFGYMLQVSHVSPWKGRTGDVYNLEVEEEHSFCVNGFAVHNCVGQSHKVILDCLSAISRYANGTVFEGRYGVAGTYTMGRVEAGGRPGRWQGSVGSWQAEAMGFGCGILLEELGLDPNPKSQRDFLRMSDKDEQMAMDWTAQSTGVPDRYEVKGRKRVISEVIPVTDVKDVQALLSNLKPVNLCGQVHPSRSRNSEGISVSLEGGGGHSTWLCGMQKTSRGRMYDMMQTWNDYYTGGYARANSPYPEDRMFASSTTQIPEKWLSRWLNSRDCFAFAGQGGLEAIDDSFKILSATS